MTDESVYPIVEATGEIVPSAQAIAIRLLADYADQSMAVEALTMRRVAYLRQLAESDQTLAELDTQIARARSQVEAFEALLEEVVPTDRPDESLSADAGFIRITRGRAQHRTAFAWKPEDLYADTFRSGLLDRLSPMVSDLAMAVLRSEGTHQRFDATDWATRILMVLVEYMGVKTTVSKPPKLKFTVRPEKLHDYLALQRPDVPEAKPQ